MNIMIDNHDTGVVVEIIKSQSTDRHRERGKERNIETETETKRRYLAQAFENFKLISSKILSPTRTLLFQQGHSFLFFSNIFTNWQLSLQTFKLIKTVFIQTTIIWFSISVRKFRDLSNIRENIDLVPNAKYMSVIIVNVERTCSYYHMYL